MLFRIFFAILLLLLLFGVVKGGRSKEEASFDVNYNVGWGNDHVLVLNQGREVQLSMDKRSGAGFESKLSYGSGYFHLRIKLPNKNSAGVVTAFYLSSDKNHVHDELDFEFLGNKEGKPITLQTNVFADGQGNREQRFKPWFDPTQDFHTYKILWNQHQIVFYVDNIPIRVFKNNTSLGVKYPKEPMKVQVSLWDGDSWATDGGQTKTNWSNAPFTAHFQGFNVPACPLADQSDSQNCYAEDYWWNQKKYWNLHRIQSREYEEVRRKYMWYDYCSDRNRNPTPPLECKPNA